MRYVFSALAVLMFLAVVVQYNDPDGPLWMAYYAVPTIWCLLAAFRQDLFESGKARGLLAVSVVAVVALTIFYWPPVSGFWHEQVWEMGKTDPQAAAIAERAREGMGLMIATAVMVLVAVWGLSRRARPRSAQRLAA